MKELIKALSRLVKIYQIPNVDNEALVYLSEWIMETYKHHDLALIQESLRNPPRNDFNTWRLTPDTIAVWIEQTHLKIENRRVVEESRIRQEEENKKHDYSPETERMIQDFKNKLLDGVQTVPKMTTHEIAENGQLRPKAIPYPSTSKEKLIDKELKRQWANEVHDKYTGKRLENWLAYEEWILR